MTPKKVSVPKSPLRKHTITLTEKQIKDLRQIRAATRSLQLSVNMFAIGILPRLDDVLKQVTTVNDRNENSE